MQWTLWTDVCTTVVTYVFRWRSTGVPSQTATVAGEAAVAAVPEAVQGIAAVDLVPAPVPDVQGQGLVVVNRGQPPGTSRGLGKPPDHRTEKSLNPGQGRGRSRGPNLGPELVPDHEKFMLATLRTI